MYRTGNGILRLIAKTEINEKGRIIISEIPYGKTINGIKEKIQEAVKDGKFGNISRIDDNTNKVNGVQLIIVPKAGSDSEVLRKQLLSSILSNSIPVQLICVDGLELKTYNVKEIIEAWYNFRLNTLKRVFNNRISELQLKIHKLEGILIALTDIDNVIKIIKKADNRADAEVKLIKQYNLTKIQANHIAEIKLYFLTKLNIGEIKEDIKRLSKDKKTFEQYFTDPDSIDGYIIDELKNGIKKYSSPRKTEILENVLDNKTQKDNLETIENSSHTIFLTKNGFIKKIDNIRTQGSGGTGRSIGKMKDEDYMIDVLKVHNHDDLLCFSSKGKLYKVPVYQIKSMQLTNLGILVNQYINLDKDETIVSLSKLSQTNMKMIDSLYFVFVTRNGLIKRTAMKCFVNTPRTGIISIKLNKGDTLIGVKKSNSDEDSVFITTEEGSYSFFKINELTPLLRNTSGVIAGAWEKDEKIVSFEIIKQDTKGQFLVTVNTNGKGKKTLISRFKQYKRTGKSRKLIHKGKIAKSVILTDEDPLMLITKNNIIQIPVSDIRQMAGDADPVDKIMKLGKDEYIL